jgi:hypothetical protein
LPGCFKLLPVVNIFCHQFTATAKDLFLLPPIFNHCRKFYFTGGLLNFAGKHLKLLPEF